MAPVPTESDVPIPIWFERLNTSDKGFFISGCILLVAVFLVAVFLVISVCCCVGRSATGRAGRPLNPMKLPDPVALQNNNFQTERSV